MDARSLSLVHARRNVADFEASVLIRWRIVRTFHFTTGSSDKLQRLKSDSLYSPDRRHDLLSTYSRRRVALRKDINRVGFYDAIVKVVVGHLCKFMGINFREINLLFPP